MARKRMQSANDSDIIVSINPSTGEELGRTEAMDRETVDRVLSQSRAAFEKWSKTPFSERKRLFRELSRVILDEKDEILRLVAQEAGKPVTEAMAAEVLPVLGPSRPCHGKADQFFGQGAFRTISSCSATNEAYAGSYRTG